MGFCWSMVKGEGEGVVINGHFPPYTVKMGDKWKN